MTTTGDTQGRDAGPAPAPRRRGRSRWLLAGAAVVVLVAGGMAAVVLTRGASIPPGVTASSSGALVVARGQGFPAGGLVQVTAALRADPASSGATSVVADGGGRFAAAFRPPAGASGRVEITAVSGGTTVRATTTTPAAPGTATEGPVPPTAVPMTGAPAARAGAVVPALPRHDVPASIPADCSADVTAPLNAWLAGVPDGSTVVFPEGGCYVVNGSLTLTGRSDLVIEGQGATFKATTRVPDHATERAQWRLDYGSRITLRDMTVLGVNPSATFDQSMEFDHDIFIRGTQTVTVENVHGGHSYGDFISIAQGVDGRTIPRDITIRDVSAQTVGRNGIACVACDGVSVTGSVLDDVALHAFDLEIEGDGRPGRHVTFSGNWVQRHGWAAFSVGTPFQTYGNDLSDIVVTGNTVTEPGWAQDYCAPAITFVYSKIPARHVVIRDNRLVSATDAIMVKAASDVTIEGNTATLQGPTCGDPVGIRTQGVTGAVVEGNVLTGYRTSYRAG